MPSWDRPEAKRAVTDNGGYVRYALQGGAGPGPGPGLDDFRLLAIMYACLVLLIFFMHRTRTERVERQGPAGDRAVAAVPAE